MRRWQRGAIALALLATACGSSETVTDGERDPAVTGTVLRLEATGDFVLENGSAASKLTGTGFSVDDGDLVVTNHHTIAGADTVQAFGAGGESFGEVVVLGSMECSDTAVVSVDASDARPFEWGDETLDIDQRVVVAGFEEAAADPTESEGAIVVPAAPGDTALTALESTVEHSAVTAPGSSGSPVLSEGATVVAMTFAQAPDGRSMLAIPAADVRSAVMGILSGDPPASWGLNVYALEADSPQGSGVWVRGVQPMSVAAEAGVRPGDIIQRLNGVNLRDDPTLGSYCAVLTEVGPDASTPIEVMRPSTVEYLSGDLNASPLSPLGFGP